MRYNSITSIFLSLSLFLVNSQLLGENAKPAGDRVWANYDFTPGDRVIFYEDFSTTGVGDFPQRLKFTKGNTEVAEWKGERWLRATSSVKFEIPLPEELPQRFTLEFDYYGPTNYSSIMVSDGTDKQGYHDRIRFFRYLESGIFDPNMMKIATLEVPERAREQVAQLRIMSDGKYLKAYVNETRVANVPQTSFGRSKTLVFEIWAHEKNPTMISNIRIGDGAKKVIYDQLMAEGSYSTKGILFASGSDEIRPESTPTLKEIGTMLKDHAELKLAIHGHTDNVGEEAYNLDLSKKRAAAVKAYLKEKYEIDEARLQTEGFGESKPVADNSTPEGRQNNRRVELQKL